MWAAVKRAYNDLTKRLSHGSIGVAVVVGTASGPAAGTDTAGTARALDTDPQAAASVLMAISNGGSVHGALEGVGVHDAVDVVYLPHPHPSSSRSWGEGVGIAQPLAEGAAMLSGGETEAVPVGRGDTAVPDAPAPPAGKKRTREGRSTHLQQQGTGVRPPGPRTSLPMGISPARAMARALGLIA
jgi:hypothetical protein